MQTNLPSGSIGIVAFEFEVDVARSGRGCQRGGRQLRRRRVPYRSAATVRGVAPGRPVPPDAVSTGFPLQPRGGPPAHHRSTAASGGGPFLRLHLCLHAGERVICSNTYKDRLAISLKVGNQPYEVLSTGQIKLLGLLCSAFTQLKLLHSKPTSLRQEASHSKWQWLGSSLQACHFPLILGMLVSSAA